MRAFIALVLTLMAAACFILDARAAQQASFSFSLARAPHALSADSSLSDPAWQAGRIPASAWEDLTTRRAAPMGTTAYMLYDDAALYVAFDVEQPAASIVAGQTTNDVGFGIDDFVGFGLDPSASGGQTYFFETTARGIRYEQASENARYRPVWQATATVGKDGHWRSVLIVPLSVLRLPPTKQQRWHINFVRGVASTGEHYSWAFDGVMQDGPSGAWPSANDVRFWPQTTLELRGARLRPKPRVEAFAIAAAGPDRGLYQQADGTFQEQRLRPFGLDASIPLTPTINFVGTIDPDFSNVEVDQQTIAPQEFRRQLAEYRPFFAQGASYINVPENPYSNLNGPGNQIFYSPAIGPFDRGEKIEGTYGMQSIGVLNFRGFDEVSGNTFDDTAFAFKHALSDRTFQYYLEGVDAHHSIAGDDQTLEAGAKGRNNASGLVWNVDQAVERGSWLSTGSARSSYGFLDIHKPFQEVLAGYADISPGYDPIDGFTQISDIHGFESFYNALGRTRWAKSVSLFVQGDRFLDESGAVHESDSSLFVAGTFNNLFSINGAGGTIGRLRGYDGVSGTCATGVSTGRTYFTGYPCYRNGQTDAFDLAQLPLGYRDGTPSPIDVSANWGVFGTNDLHFYTASTSRQFGRATVGMEYDASFERDRTTSLLQTQFLRRLSVGFTTGADSNLTIGLRGINGLGGFAPAAGVNFSAAYHARLRNGDLYVNYGTPAANETLHRFIVKYVVRAGADSGT